MVNNRVIGRVTGSFGFGYDSFKSVALLSKENNSKTCFALLESEYTQIGGTLIQGDYIGFSLNVQTNELVFLVNGVVRYRVEKKIPWPQELYPAGSIRFGQFLLK